MSSPSPMAAVRWHVYETRGGIYLNLNGTPVFVCSLPAQMGPGWCKSGRAVIPITTPPTPSASLLTQAETADQRPVPNISPFFLRAALDAHMQAKSPALSSLGERAAILEFAKAARDFLPIWLESRKAKSTE